MCPLISCGYDSGMAFPNRYKGNCKTCGTFVPAGEGIYEQGMTTCTDTVAFVDSLYTYWLCVPAYNKQTNANHTTREEAAQAEYARRDAQVADVQKTVLENLINGELVELATKANVRSLAQVITKVTGAEIAVADLNFEQATDVRHELQTRIHRKNASKVLDEYKSNNTCNRCGGAGQADKWHATGRICYKCGGSGKFYN